MKRFSNFFFFLSYIDCRYNQFLIDHIYLITGVYRLSESCPAAGTQMAKTFTT